jgi:hypothetical protein
VDHFIFHFSSQIVLEKHVNLVDLVRGSRENIRIFESEKELSEYTKETEKFFPKENAVDGGVLRALRRHILEPRESRARQSSSPHAFKFNSPMAPIHHTYASALFPSGSTSFNLVPAAAQNEPVLPLIEAEPPRKKDKKKKRKLDEMDADEEDAKPVKKIKLSKKEKKALKKEKKRERVKDANVVSDHVLQIFQGLNIRAYQDISQKKERKRKRRKGRNKVKKEKKSKH